MTCAHNSCCNKHVNDCRVTFRYQLLCVADLLATSLFFFFSYAFCVVMMVAFVCAETCSVADSKYCHSCYCDRRSSVCVW